MKLFSKKLISLLLSCMLVFSMSIPTIAAENDTTTDGLFIITEEVPTEAISYTQETIASIIGDLYPLNTVTVGQPFVVHGQAVDLYYFLVYSKGDLVASYRVYQAENNEYTGILSEHTEILDGFANLMDITSLNTPAKIVGGEFEDLYAVIDDNILTVVEDYAGNITDSTSILQKASATYSLHENVVNAAEGIAFEGTSKQRVFTDYKFLQIGWEELQEDNNWCSAYATASIIRHVKKLPLDVCNAKIIMEYTFPSLGGAALKEKALSLDNAVRYANTQHGLAAKVADRVIDYATLKSEINADRPVYFSGLKITGAGDSAHAFVCRGYLTEGGKTFYSVWNPWNPEYERVPTSTKIYSTENGAKQYQFKKTIYGWKKK